MINAVRRVMLGRFVCTVLFAFSVCAAFGDVVWPTAQVGKDGDLSSNEGCEWQKRFCERTVNVAKLKIFNLATFDGSE